MIPTSGERIQRMIVQVQQGQVASEDLYNDYLKKNSFHKWTANGKQGDDPLLSSPSPSKRTIRPPIGAFSNKLYNCKIKQFPDQSKTKVCDLEVQAKDGLDEATLKKKLTSMGLQVVQCSVTQSPIKPEKQVQGKLQIRINGATKDEDHMKKSLADCGLTVSAQSNQPKVKRFKLNTGKKKKPLSSKLKIDYKYNSFFSRNKTDDCALTSLLKESEKKLLQKSQIKASGLNQLRKKLF